MVREFKGCNGAKIVVNAAPFKVTKQLRQCIAKELLKHNVDIGNPKSIAELKGAFNSNVSQWVNLFKDVILGLETSEEFENIIYKCFSECTYDNKGVTEVLFDDIPKAREDYDLMVMEVIKENLSPFLKSLAGEFKAHNATIESGQQQQ